MYEHREADRVPIIDTPWASTLERWRREGLPADADWRDYFDVDKTAHVSCDNSPRFEKRVLEETDEYVISTTAWGATLKQFKHHGGVPKFLDFKIKDFESWLEIRKRMTLDDSRIPWERLKRDYAKWRAEGRWIIGTLWFGFDVTHSWEIGTETALIALMEEPEWIRDMYECSLRLDLEMLERVWDAGYRFDEINWPDDMGYKGSQFFSLKTFRELEKPYIKRAIDWAHDRGIYARLHSCGNIMPFVPELAGIGLDGLNPLEVKAGMDVPGLKRRFGEKLLFHGGINAVLWDKPELIKQQIAQTVPVMKQNGGYIFASDHSIPESVSLEDFAAIIKEVKQVGKY